MIAISWYDAVTFDLIRSGLSRTTFPSRGRLSLRRVLRIEFERAGHAAAPTRKNDTASRPSSGTFGATSPCTVGIRPAGSAYGILAGGACRRPYSAPPGGVPFQISSLSP